MSVVQKLSQGINNMKRKSDDGECEGERLGRSWVPPEFDTSREFSPGATGTKFPDGQMVPSGKSVPKKVLRSIEAARDLLLSSLIWKEQSGKVARMVPSSL